MFIKKKKKKRWGFRKVSGKHRMLGPIFVAACPMDLNGRRAERPFKLWPPETVSESIKNKPGNKYP